jgi:Abortive infection C-terminus
LRPGPVERTELRSLIPRFVETCRDQHQFWAYIKGQFGTYQERRQFTWTQFAPLLTHLESGAHSPADADILATLNALNPDDVGSVWRRALERRVSDPKGAITIARSLLETVCKHNIDGSGGSYGHADDLPKLYHTAATHLSLAPSQHTEDVFKQILGGCQSVVNGLGALRNRLGDAHGKASSRSSRLRGMPSSPSISRAPWQLFWQPLGKNARHPLHGFNEMIEKSHDDQASSIF